MKAYFLILIISLAQSIETLPCRTLANLGMDATAGIVLNMLCILRYCFQVLILDRAETWN